MRINRKIIKCLTIYILMNTNCIYHLKKTSRSLAIVISIMLLTGSLNPLGAQTTETISAGSFIVNMGVVPQTIGNGLKPYGMVYDLILNYKVPVKWIIAPGKVKDGVDFTYNGVDYKGGPFVILAEYRSAAVNARIAYWLGIGVVGTTTTSPIDVPVAMTLLVSSVPRWTLDLLNGSVSVPYFQNAGIPDSSYSVTRNPSDLNDCDDIFVMPHAYPQWSTHGNLYTWNKNYKGSIWTSCTAVSELEDMFNPDDHTQQTNFLSNLDTSVPFPSSDQPTTIENALVLYTDHNSGTLPYTYSNSGDPFMQFMGTIDAATQNGLEQIYIPKSQGWRTTTTIGAWDPDNTQVYNSDQYHRAAIIAYGRAFGDPTRGYVMIEAGHSLSNATQPANIAAQRIFFNFSLVAGKNSTVIPDVSGIPTSVVSAMPTPISFVFPIGVNPSAYTVTLSSFCGGTFVQNPAYPGDQTKWIFTPPATVNAISCPVTVSISDACGRVFNTSQTSVLGCNIQVTTTNTSACNTSSYGKMTMNITGAGGAYNWSWTRLEGGSGSGSNPTSPIVISNLSVGTYTVTVVSGSGAGCQTTFTDTISTSTAITFNNTYLTPANVLCNGNSSGSIAVTKPTGGVPPYTYDWGGGITTQNRNELSAGIYSVTAIDANSCTASASTTITEPAVMAVTTTSITPVKCKGQSTGAISISVTGGTSPYAYAWNDGNTSQNRTGIAAGSYSVTVTDVNGCTYTLAGITITEPVASISLSATTTDVNCFGGSTGSAINLSVSGGTAGYSYSWNNTETTQNLSNVPTGSYTVTVTDANNCTAILSKTINQPTAITLSTTSVNQSCPGANDGTITLSVSGGTAGYTYLWNNSAITQNLSGLTAGTYSVTVTDTKSCTASTSVTIGTTKSNAVARQALIINAFT